MVERGYTSNVIEYIKTHTEIIPLRRYNSKRIAIKQDMCKAYLTSFLKSVNKISSDRLRTESNQPSTNHEVTHDVKIALYRYLKVLWDKWLSGNPLRTTKWGLKEFTKHWYFLDSYYNRIGDKTYLNVQSLAEDLKATLNTQGYNMLNFLFTSYGRNKMGLYCVQNFLGMLDKEKMEHMFKPMPYSQIDTSKIDEIPDFIVMQTGEFSSKLNIPGAEYADDSFMIATEDIPESIKTKKSILSDANGDGYPIPAFGVTIGKQYQSYFTDVRIAMDSPIVTEQSLRAQFALASANSGQKDSGESKNEVKMLGQDLYTIYSNNSYTCDVQMLGCAWIQPLMYFQLNNVPMYRGTYLVQKVSHHIAPGQMVTTFKGTRMSRLKTPMVKLYYETSRESS